MEFPSLPKFFTSRHAYGRLYDTTSPPSYSSDINAVKLSFKSLFSQKFRWRHIMKSLDEKFLIICSESGNVTKLEKILRKKRSNMSDQTLIDGYHIVTYCGYYETVRYFLEDLKIPINVRTKVRN